MPRVRRQNVPPALFQHLLDRVQSRKIPASQLELLASGWTVSPRCREGQWYKRFSGMTVCGEGELIKTFSCSPAKRRRATLFLEIGARFG